MRQKLLLPVLTALVLCSFSLSAQIADRWQQRVRYDMDIDFNVANHQYAGQQELVYFNNSPDTLDRVFYHLYFNAFQPNSEMDVRSRTIADADRRVGSRINELKEDEIGFIRVNSLMQNNRPVEYDIQGTILEARLPQPVLPGDSAVFRMEFLGQVPLQIRRSGRDNAEGISYSMTQWYPKMAEYDYQGWHAHPYIGREFHGVWGEFNVDITIDKDYLIGGTGYLQNPQEIGHGYTDKPVQRRGKKITYRFHAPGVHDFAWAADPDYTHTSLQRKDGTVLHFFYEENERTKENWEALPAIMDRAFDYVNENFGQYPYKQYTFLQGGDGGMEYPMATLITGERTLSSLVGVSVHELMHSWYQGVLATNESLYAWMDEGFTSWASDEVMNFLRQEKLIPGDPVENPHLGDLAGMRRFVQTGLEEPLSTHADHFNTNMAYGVASYTKGAIFLEQLRYIMGDEAFRRGMLRYYRTWGFRHPNDNDFIRIMEKESGMELDWYREYFVNTTLPIDYAVEEVTAEGDDQTLIRLAKPGRMPMPVDLLVSLNNGQELYYNIPLRIMRGEKPQPEGTAYYAVLPDWPWVFPDYSFLLPVKKEDIKSVEIFPSGQVLDINTDNNVWPTPPADDSQGDK